MSVSAVDSVGGGSDLVLEGEIPLSDGLEEMAQYLRDNCRGFFSGHTCRRERMQAFFFVLRSFFSHMEKQSKDSSYEKLRHSIGMISIKYAVFSWDVNTVIRFIETLSREKHHIPLRDLKNVAISLLRSAYDDIPASCCDFCSDQRLEMIRGTLLGLVFFLGKGNFGSEVDRIVEDMNGYFTSTMTTVPNGLRHKQLSIRTYIDRLLKLFK